MSTRGAEAARSTTTNPANSAAERAMRVTTRAEPQPHVLPWEIASRRARSAVVSSTAPTQSGRGESRGGDSGTNATTARSSAPATANMNQNTAATETLSTSTPPSSRPTAAPLPAAATSSPIQTGARPWG